MGWKAKGMVKVEVEAKVEGISRPFWHGAWGRAK